MYICHTVKPVAVCLCVCVENEYGPWSECVFVCVCARARTRPIRPHVDYFIRSRCLFLSCAPPPVTKHLLLFFFFVSFYVQTASFCV